MKTRLYFLLLLILCSCHTQTDDFISKYCPGSCTVITGRLTTDGGTKPLAGVKLDLNWHSGDPYGFDNASRRKAITTTDANGNYELRFLQRDDELTEGHFNVIAHLPEDKYYFCANAREIESFSDLKRDTTIILNYELPQIAYIQVKVNNLQAKQPNDYLATEFSFSAPCTPVIVWGNSGPQNTASVGANQQVIIQSTKIKSGIRTETIDSVSMLQPGEVYTYQITF
ncbi:hypothetical protein WG947_03070 [Pontibacter sp. H259]|uniref:hypothetical protein n=1 Tax=Pontibacter sp. H259 TaxID=3133421 RepID=UPI0030BB290E